MPEETTPIKHPSFGLIAFSRGHYGSSLKDGEWDDSTQNHALFGSSILQSTVISVTIRRAELVRHLNSDRIFASDEVPIVELEMSPTQFAEAITSFNEGDGVPCTITEVAGKSMPAVPFQNKRVQFDNEFNAKMKNITSKTNQFYSEIGRILSKPSLGKHDREEILKQIRLLQQEIDANIPFVKTQFTERMNQTVLEAKNEFETYIEGKIRKLGLEGFKKELAMLRKDNIAALESKEDSETQ